MECIFVISHEYSQKTANKRKLWNGQSDFFFSSLLYINISSVVEFQRFLQCGDQVSRISFDFFEMEEHGASEASNYNWS